MSVIALVCACTNPEPPSLIGPYCETRTSIGFAPNKIDLLLVVDTSPSMADHADNLRDNLRRFGAVLEGIEGGIPDLHLAVITADLGAGSAEFGACRPGGDGGRFQTGPQLPGCAVPDGAFLRDTPLPWFQCPEGEPSEACRERNYEGGLADAIECMVPTGGAGCEFPQPLEAMKRALSSADGDAFMRQDSILAVVFITDSDDCSADPALFDPDDPALGPLTAFRCVEHGLVCDDGPPGPDPGVHTGCRARRDSLVRHPDTYIEFLHGLDRPHGSVVAAIVSGQQIETIEVIDGPDGAPALAPACDGPGGDATPSVRLTEIVPALPQRATAHSICNEDQSEALILIAQLFAEVLAAPCLSHVEPDDVDPDEPGLQLGCVVSFVTQEPERTETLIPQCAMSAPDRPAADTQLPCWWVQEAPPEFGPECGILYAIEGAPPSPLGVAELRCEAVCPFDADGAE